MSRLPLLLLLLVLTLRAGALFAQKPPTTTPYKLVGPQKVKSPVVVNRRKASPTGKKGAKGELFPEPPAVLPVQELPFERLTSREIWNNPRERHRAQTSAERFIKFSGEKLDSTQYGPIWRHSKPVLLYRKTQSDSVWTVINLVLPDYASHETRGKLEWERDNYHWTDIFKIDTLNLDHRGEPEVLVFMVMDCCGNAVNTEYVGINLISVGEAPKLLLAALIATNESGGYSDDNKPFAGGYVRRQIKLGPALTVGKIAANVRGWENLLTPLKSGRYTCREGHLVWLGP